MWIFCTGRDFIGWSFPADSTFGPAAGIFDPTTSGAGGKHIESSPQTGGKSQQYFFLQFRGYLFILFLRLRDHISSWVQVCKLDKDGKVQNRIFKIGKSKLLFYVLKLSTL